MIRAVPNGEAGENEENMNEQNMMKLMRHAGWLLLAAFVLGACAEDRSDSYDGYETLSLAAWMAQHRPDLVENYQEDEESGFGYYVEVLDPGIESAGPVNDTVCWVSFDFTGRDLAGNVVLTRDASVARQEGTYTRYTRYVPFYRHCGLSNSSMIEGTYLAMRNKLLLGERYAAEHDLDREILLREGSRVRLYMPSLLVGGNGLEGDGGYEGHVSLSSQRPLIVTLEIRDTVKNPLAREGSLVDGFCGSAANGGLKIYTNEKDVAASSLTRAADPLPADPEDKNHPYNVAERWTSICDTIPQLYVNLRYDPAQDELAFPEPYDVGLEPYNDFAGMEKRIREALVERFHPDEEEPYKGVKALTDSVKLDGTAKIWYVGRFLDGFVFDTNIDEVKQIVYGEVKSAGSALSYVPEDGGMIQAFYYVVPQLRFGQWATIVTTSTYGYGASGKSGSTTTSSSGGNSSSYYDYLNYLNYANSYYGSGYGGYYGGYYGNYYGGYYNPYYGYGYGSNYTYEDSESTTTVKSVSTEIPPFAPLIFQIYVEPAK